MSGASFSRKLLAILLLPFMVAAVIPYLLERFKPEEQLFEMIAYPPSRWIIGMLFALLGAFFFGSTLNLFIKKGKGTLAPWDPPKILVIAGPYKWIRNPMITGVLFILLAEAILLCNEYLLIWAGLFFLVNHIYFILKEEPDLEKRFGDDYKQYKKEVPRWFPRFKP